MQVLVAGKPDTLHLPIEAAWHAFQAVDFLTAISFVANATNVVIVCFVFLLQRDTENYLLDSYS